MHSVKPKIEKQGMKCHFGPDRARSCPYERTHAALLTVRIRTARYPKPIVRRVQSGIPRATVVWKYLKNRIGDVGVAHSSAEKQLHDIVARFLRSESDCRCGVLHCNFQYSNRSGSLKATTRVVAEIRGRVPEQLERDINGMKEYPTEASDERRRKNERALSHLFGLFTIYAFRG
jgi:hypothetical protein